MNDDIETVRKGLTLYPRVNKDDAHDALDRIEAELDAWKHRLNRLEATRDDWKAEIERLHRLVETVDRQRIANGEEVERLRAAGRLVETAWVTGHLRPCQHRPTIRGQQAIDELRNALAEEEA